MMFWGWSPWLQMKTKRNSQVTIELRKLVHTGFKLFDFDYPIWKEDHREELQRKIINHYAMRQIGFETPGRFKHELMCRLQEIMPRYVKLYATTQYKYNPIENYNMLEKGEDTSEGNSEGSGSSKNRNRYSDTPMGSIDNLETHLTNATLDDTENSTSSKDKRKDIHHFTRTGNIGVTTTQQMIEQERKITIDLDMMIIEDLKDLFLQVY